ncbi:DUF1214 domain-containing protein [Sedimentitalea sp.]|uniref:DUF1214 domain-containing protein n=1 Tax=Sedimentitalea sp. TaxID=2048915 RepID=UPI0032971D0A
MSNLKTFARGCIAPVALAITAALPAQAQDTVENYIREYPNQQQVRMMTDWLKDNTPGNFTFTGLVDPDDDTVVTPQATVNYGYNWFSLTDGPAVLTVPEYDRFFSVSVFDMKHNIPAVVVSPDKPILLTRPGYDQPEGDFTVVNLETDQGLILTRMVVVDNIDDVMALSEEIIMEGGDGDMTRPVQRFSDSIRESGEHVISAMVEVVNVDVVFGSHTGAVGELSRAAGVMQGQLGTPTETVRYALSLTDDDGQPLKGDATYEVTVPAGIVEEDGYFSVTAYGTDNKLLIPNDQGIYDSTTYSAEPNDNGTFTITLSPDASGQNAIPTGKDFYLLTRAYVPVAGADLQPKIEKLSTTE